MLGKLGKILAPSPKWNKVGTCAFGTKECASNLVGCSGITEPIFVTSTMFKKTVKLLESLKL